jgi:hypothetical protein
MAGRNSGFNAREFRDAIRFAQNMGAAPLAEEQATFYFPSTLVYNRPTDDANVPFDPNATVTRNVPTPVRVACSIEYIDAQGQTVRFGSITASKVIITVLDEEFRKIDGCAYVAIHGDKYIYTRTEPPTGLFDVGLYRLHFLAENET